MIKEWRAKAGPCLVILIISGIIGLVLLMMSYLLPVVQMAKHATESLEIFQREGPTYELVPGVPSTRLDNYTDALMINTAICQEGDGLWKKAVSANRYQFSDDTAFGSTVAYLTGDEDYTITSYARYWHGYLIILKPLLLLVGYGEIRILNSLFLIAITIYLITMMYRFGIFEYIKAFLLGVFCLVPVTLAMCMQYSFVYYVTISMMIFLVSKYNVLQRKKRFEEFYFFLGILTCFFDLLTYPLVTLGFNCLMHLILETRYGQLQNLKKQIFRYVKYCCFWGGGLLGFWGVKWIIATIILKENIIKDAILSVLYRSSSECSDSGTTVIISRGEALIENLRLIINNKIFVLLMVIVIAYIIYNRRHFKVNVKMLLMLSIIFIMPFVWILLMANHSYVHYWMTYKNFSVAAFSAATLLVICKNTKSS